MSTDAIFANVTAAVVVAGIFSWLLGRIRASINQLSEKHQAMDGMFEQMKKYVHSVNYEQETQGGRITSLERRMRRMEDKHK